MTRRNQSDRKLTPDVQTARGMCHSFLMHLDHVSYAVHNSELADTVQRLGAELGASFIDGGKHPRFGTRNFILPLASGAYIEVVAPLDHPATDSAPFGRAVRERADSGGGWLGWVVAISNLSIVEEAIGRAAAPGHRIRPDGVDLTWQQIGVLDLMASPALPYFIKWDDGVPHPAQGGNASISISEIEICGDRDMVSSWLGASSETFLDSLNLSWVDQDEEGLASVTFTTPHGTVHID